MDSNGARWAGAGALLLWLGVATLVGPRSWPVALVTGATAAAVVLLCRTTRGRALLPGVAALAAAWLVLCVGSPQTVGWFGTCVLVVVTYLGVSRVAGVVLAGGFALAMGLQALVVPDPGWFAWLGGLGLTLVACWVIEREQALVVELRQAQAGLAERSRLEERTRIAHEMHDVMGHALTVSLLHITSARLAVEEDPAAAAASLAEAERLSRRSLEEVRAAVGVLRDGSAPGAPAPGVGDLADLVDAVRRGGVDVRLARTGPKAGLSEVTGLAVYRIVQEALTNVARHAPAAPTTVDLTVGEEGLVLRVDSAAPARADARPGGGIASMTERAVALGGTLAAGPGGPGWRVEARLPLPAGLPTATGVPA